MPLADSRWHCDKIGVRAGLLQLRSDTFENPETTDGMTSLKYTKPETDWLKAQAELNERWRQDRIAEDPSILGIADLVLRKRERIQSRAGRLDLLLVDDGRVTHLSERSSTGTWRRSAIRRTGKALNL